MHGTHLVSQPVSDEQWMELGPALFRALDVGWRLALHCAGDNARPALMKPEALQAISLAAVPARNLLAVQQMLFGMSHALQMLPEATLIEMHSAGRVALMRDKDLANDATTLASLAALSHRARDTVSEVLRSGLYWRITAFARVPAGKPMAEIVQRLAAPLTFHGDARHGLALGLCCALAALSDTARQEIFQGALDHELKRMLTVMPAT